MVAYAILDVDIYDIADYLTYQKKLASLFDAVGACYLARGGESRVYQGGYEPRRLMLVEFPSLEIMDEFFNSAAYRALAPQRDACSETQIIAVDGL